MFVFLRSIYIWPVSVLISGGYRANPHPLWVYSVPSQSHLLQSTHFGLSVFSCVKHRTTGLPAIHTATCVPIPWKRKQTVSETSSLYSVILENVLLYFNVCRVPRMNRIQNIQLTNKMHFFNISDVFYSQCPHQHVSASFLTFFRAVFLLQEYKRTIL